MKMLMMMIVTIGMLCSCARLQTWRLAPRIKSAGMLARESQTHTHGLIDASRRSVLAAQCAAHKLIHRMVKMDPTLVHVRRSIIAGTVARGARTHSHGQPNAKRRNAHNARSAWRPRSECHAIYAQDSSK